MTPGPLNDLERLIEAAFDYRGHVTITLKHGERVVGYVYNRQLAHPTLREAPFVEVFLAGSGDSHKIAVEAIHAIELTGKDYAAPNPPPDTSTELADPSHG
jgi:hypothetical protein